MNRQDIGLSLVIVFGIAFGFLSSAIFLLLYYSQSFTSDIPDALRFRSSIIGTLFVLGCAVCIMNRDWIVKEFRRGLDKNEDDDDDEIE